MIRDLANLSNDIDTARTGYFNTWKFGYLGEINASHNTSYPLLLLLPPSSEFKEVYSNDEKLTLVFHMYRKEILDDYGNPQPLSSLALEQTYDDLLHRFKMTMEGLCKGREDEYVLSGRWTIDRVSKEFNDDLVGLVITVDLNKYSFCLAE